MSYFNEANLRILLRCRRNTLRGAWILVFASLLVGGVHSASAKIYPKVFGTKVELPSKNIKTFPKWTGMLGRWKGGTVKCNTSTCTTKGPASLIRVSRSFTRTPTIQWKST